MQNLIAYAPQLLSLLEPVLVALIGLAIARVTAFINARIKSENAKAALLQLTDLAETTVKALEQTVVADLKDATKDGEFTAAEAQAVKDRAIALVLAQMGPASEIAKRLGMQEADRLRAFIESKIEASVYKMRQERDRMLLLGVRPEMKELVQ